MLAAIPQRARRGLMLALVGLLGSAMLAPVAALADTNLAVGGQARIAHANGDNVRLRSAAGYGATVVDMIPEGTLVDVVDGPITADDGSLWYSVAVNGHAGFIVADYLALPASSASTTSNPGQSSGTAAPDATGAPPDANAPKDVTGTAIVAGTNGDGVRCRAEPSSAAAVITVLPEGATVELTGTAVDVWQPVNCAGRSGYVRTDFVSFGGTPPTPDAGSAAAGSTDGSTSLAGTGPSFSAASVGGTAIVTGTNGDGVRCRSKAGTDAPVVVVLAEGTSVQLRGDLLDGWYPVLCADTNGWIRADFLAQNGGGSSGSGSPSGGASAASVGGVIGTANVTGTNGGGLRCRSDASFNASIIAVLGEGSSVSLRGAAQGVWQPVVCAGSNGFVHSDYLSYDGGRPSASGGSPGGGSTSGLVAGDAAMVSNTGGSGVRLRSGPGFDQAIITVVGEGKVVDVRDGSTGNWVAVTYNGSDGYILGDYLTKTGAGSGTQPSGGGGSGGLGSGAHAMTTANLNLRYDASFTAGVAAVAPQGTVVAVTGGPSNGFYPVDWDGLKGFMFGDYLSLTDAALSQRGGSGSPGTAGGGAKPGSNQGSASGSAIVNYAMQYLGYPYVWATHGPGSFDCSGFTYWVALNVLGIDIGTGLWTQVSAGTSVAYDNLQPGDLVFFQNTFQWGLSHGGIYIGNGQFIHAENESTGVVISNLGSPYYSSRWYGAVRLA